MTDRSSILAYQNRLRVVRARAAASVGDMYDALPDYHQPQAEPFAQQASRLVRAGQLLAAGTTNAYIARAARIQPPRLDVTAVTGPAARRGVDPLEEYQRPFGIVWSALAVGADLADAVRQGRDRLVVLAATDIWLAARAAAAFVDEATPKITGWVRVADASACDLCSAADGMPTALAADMAGHPNCGCTQEPTFDDSPDSSAQDPEAVDVHDHDELGPVLYAAGQKFEAA